MKEERKLDENAYLSITSTTYPDKAAGLINDTRSNVTHCLVMLFACSLYCPIGKRIEGHIYDDVYPLSTEIFVFFFSRYSHKDSFPESTC